MADDTIGWYGVAGGKLAGGTRPSDDAKVLGVTLLDTEGAPINTGLGVSGFVVGTANFTPAAAAYAAGDIQDIAKEMQFTDRNGVLVPAGSGIRILSSVMKIGVTAIPSGMTSFIGQLYSVTPPSAQADNDAWTLAAGDLAAYRGSVNLGSPADLGGALYVKSQYIDTDINLGSGKSSLFMQLQTIGAYTATAVARTVILYGVML